MDNMGLKSKIRPRKRDNRHKGQTSHIATNVLTYSFTLDIPNMVWVNGATEFRIVGTKACLSPITNLYDRSILAHEISISPSTKFISQSLKT